MTSSVIANRNFIKKCETYVYYVNLYISLRKQITMTLTSSGPAPFYIHMQNILHVPSL